MRRPWILRRGPLLSAAAALSLIGAVAWGQELLKVVEREAAIRRDKRTYSPRVATVMEGEEVTLIAREPPWLRVEYQGVQGWLNESSVTDDPNAVFSREAQAKGVRATEQSAARRGFSPEVEEKHRQQNPELETAFKLIDKIQESWVFPEDEVMKFMEAGKIVPPAEGGSK